eukprot:gene10087-2150_t
MVLWELTEVRMLARDARVKAVGQLGIWSLADQGIDCTVLRDQLSAPVPTPRPVSGPPPGHAGDDASGPPRRREVLDGAADDGMPEIDGRNDHGGAGGDEYSTHMSEAQAMERLMPRGEPRIACHADVTTAACHTTQQMGPELRRRSVPPRDLTNCMDPGRVQFGSAEDSTDFVYEIKKDARWNQARAIRRIAQHWGRGALTVVHPPGCGKTRLQSYYRPVLDSMIS